MSFSPESFERLLAEKLAKAPAPPYEPAHWGQLEGRLQHLNQALQAASQSAASAPATGLATATVSSAAKFGLAALIAGVTALNGYLFYAAQTVQTPVSAVITAPPISPVVAVDSSPKETVGAVAANPSVAVESSIAVAPVARGVAAPHVALQQSSAPAAVVAAELPGEPTPMVGEGATSSSSPVVEQAPAVTQPLSMDAIAPEGAAASASHRLSDERPSQLDETPNIITPNGDGLNDRFELPIPVGTCRLTVFDRANRIVFSADAYDNTWNGSALPAGEYLYLLEGIGSATWRLPGRISIRR
jgi:gliding motility-associated-like protein